MWVQGPQWASDNQTIQRLTPIILLRAEEAQNEQSDADANINVEITESESLQRTFDITRFSRLNVALHTVAKTAKLLHRWVSRTNSRGKVNIQAVVVSKFSTDIQICAEDIECARKLLIWEVHKGIDEKDLQQRYKNFKIVRDKDGIIRHHSRLQNASIPMDAKSPIFLPTSDDLTKLVLRDIHENNAHCGKDHTLTISRERFWIPRPSSAFKTALGKCTICKRWQGLPFGAPQMPPLPLDRVTATKPFGNTACDFIGPFDSKSGETMFICLYTCLTTRAVHLELVENLSAGAFLNSFIRFCSRRGVPNMMCSDCGTNFKSASKLIDLMFENDEVSGNSLMGYCAIKGIKWIFNPPASPWMGGVWERLVGSVKKCLRKSIGRKKLSFIDMNTALIRIEAIINTRPITKLNSSVLDEIPLRPVDFLHGNLKFSLPNAQNLVGRDDTLYEPDVIHTVSQAREAMKSSENLASKYWEHWSKEYLLGLRESQKIELKQKRHIRRTCPEIGEIVLIGEDILPRGCWSYGKITNVITSNDGLIRSAKVILPNRKIIHRPLNKIYPLEIRSCDESESSPQNDCLRQPENVPEGHLRKRLERKSKTKAYDVIKAFENELDDSQDIQSSSEFNATVSRSSTARTSNSYLRTCSKNTTMLTFLLVIINLIGVQSSSPSISCYDGEVTISPPSDKYKLCFDDECQMFNNRSEVARYKLPVSPHMHQVHVLLAYRVDNVSSTMLEICERPDFCLESQSILSRSLIGNPHCWPVGALISVVLIVYLFGASLLFICWTSKILTRSKKRGIQNARLIIAEQMELNEWQQTRPHGYAPTPLSGRNAIVLTIALLAASITDACQHGFARHSTELVCRHDGRCTYEIRRELLFNKLRLKHCIEINSYNRTVGLITVELKPISFTCVKASRFFTKDTNHQIFYSLRCPEMGSCTPGKCHSVQPNETIPELSAAHSFPGYTACDYSCTGILCGCLLPTPACLFYRVAHIPTSHQIYEVFTCQEWSPLIQLEVETQFFGKKETRDFSLLPYVETSINAMNMTVLSVQMPSHSLLSRRFAQSAKETIILPELFRNPVECTTKNEAENSFEKCENKIICNCPRVAKPDNCRCPEDSIGQVRRDASNVLPLETAYLELRSESNTIIAETRETEITIEVESLLFANSSELVVDDTCSVNMTKLSGCYSCIHGSQVAASCIAQHKTVAEIRCHRHTFAIHCSIDGNETIIHLNYDSADVREACEVTCGGKTTSFTLEGNLVYHRTPNVSVFWHNTHESKRKWSDLLDFHLPDLSPLLKTIRNHWKMAVFLAVTATSILGMTYLLGPVCILAIIKIIGSAITCFMTPFLRLVSAGRSQTARAGHQ
ncbi:integrase core domain protein [Oesophagostomum dentatum]|uniref:Integrase core domain protein n=1 Tax=Oesophagostomum dentatum TaxID=61180 RepID=A0A0B1TBQ5_OESDE|nr:integrase core domain protein [Oesophagostomum dentatum]